MAAALARATWCRRACSYIRYGPDREPVKQELMWHIEDERAELEADGLAPEEAEARAVHNLGDADETGRMLRRAHKPYLGWCLSAAKCLLAIAAACAFSILIFGGGEPVLRAELSQPKGVSGLCDPEYSAPPFELIGQASMEETRCGDYNFSAVSACYWRLPAAEYDRVLGVMIKAETARFWQGRPMLDGLYAVDDRGRTYLNYPSGYSQPPEAGCMVYNDVSGQTVSHKSVTVYLRSGAKWLELRTPYSRAFSLHIDLPEDAA